MKETDSTMMASENDRLGTLEKQSSNTLSSVISYPHCQEVGVRPAGQDRATTSPRRELGPDMSEDM